MAKKKRRNRKNKTKGKPRMGRMPESLSQKDNRVRPKRRSRRLSLWDETKAPKAPKVTKATERKRFTDAAKKEWTPELATMPYKEFLATKYWQLIKHLKRMQTSGRCEKCRSMEMLHTHHIHYKNRGSEHKHLDCLMILCCFCHAKEHGK